MAIFRLGCVVGPEYHGPGPLDRSRESCTAFGRGHGRNPFPILFLHLGYRWTLVCSLAHALLLSLIPLPADLTTPAPAAPHSKLGKGCTVTSVP